MCLERRLHFVPPAGKKQLCITAPSNQLRRAAATKLRNDVRRLALVPAAAAALVKFNNVYQVEHEKFGQVANMSFEVLRLLP